MTQKEILVSETEINQTITKLKGISHEYKGKLTTVLTFQGDLEFTRAGDELRSIMEKIGNLWRMASDKESGRLQETKATLQEQDAKLSARNTRGTIP